MPIAIVCENCGKRLTVKDEFIGKRLKCPKCQVIFTASPEDAVEPVAKSPAALPTPAARKPAVLAGQEKQPRLHVSPGIIALIIAAIAIPTLFFLWHIGPGHVQTVWSDAQQPAAEMEIKDVVDRILQSHLSHTGGYNPLKAHAVPHALDVNFITSPLYMSMPEQISFVGTSTQGAFRGAYHPLSREISVDVEIGGMSLPGVNISRGDTEIHGTGRTKDGKLSAEIDGHPADILVPKSSPAD